MTAIAVKNGLKKAPAAQPTNEPMTNEPMTNEPMTNEPMTNEPMTNEPMTNEPMTEETAFLLTDAGLDALHHAPVVPDEDITEEDAAEDAADTFTPDNREKADWVLSKIADARARAARIREHGEAMARQADADAERLLWKFGPALQDLARRETTNGRRKSLPLYHGVIGFRTKPAGVAITDDAAALSWAKENAPAAVAERLDRKALGDVLRASGEVLPFAEFTQPEEVFYIK